jgi:large subunit ribosomal protein L24
MAGRLNVKKGDTVLVRSGKDRGLRGKVILTYPDASTVLVEGANRVKKHTKVTRTARGSQAGGIVHQEAPIHVSNVMVICPNCKKASRLGHRRDEDGHGVRVCRRCNEDL